MSHFLKLPAQSHDTGRATLMIEFLSLDSIEDQVKVIVALRIKGPNE